MNDREKWLMERKTYLGGSDIAAIIGLNTYKSPLAVYLDKTLDVMNEITNEAIQWGNILEPIVAQQYSLRTGFNIEIQEGVIRHPEHSFLGANIDRWANNKTHVLECKTTSFMNGKMWGDEGTDQIPETYLCQVAYYAGICNIEKVDIAVLIGGQSLKIYTYNRNKEFEDKLFKIAINFWNNHVIKRVQPESSRREDISLLYPKSNESIIKADSVIIHKTQMLKELTTKEKDLTKEINNLKIDIQAYMKDNDTLVDHSDNVIVTWKSSKPRAVIDIQALKEENFDICSKYMKETNGSRTFLIKS